jgi:frataxin-like iron-binding protein CyaY
MAIYYVVGACNGSTHNIWCRVDDDQTLMKQGATGGSPDVHDIGVNTHKTEQVQHIAEATEDYVQISKGNTLTLESSTPSNSIYMTVRRETGRAICQTLEIGTSTNYIINRHEALLKYIVCATISNIYFDFINGKETSGHTACKENKTR